jgi:integrase
MLTIVSWLVGRLLYGNGLRVLEALRLRTHDVDFTRGELLIRHGKGGKDRRTMLPAAARAELLGQLDRPAWWSLVTTICYPPPTEQSGSLIAGRYKSLELLGVGTGAPSG